MPRERVVALEADVRPVKVGERLLGTTAIVVTALFAAVLIMFTIAPPGFN